MGKSIKGYKKQSDETIELVNEFKDLEKEVLDQINIVRIKHKAGFHVNNNWLDSGHMKLQTAFMMLNRALLQPND